MPLLAELYSWRRTRRTKPLKHMELGHAEGEQSLFVLHQYPPSPLLDQLFQQKMVTAA